MKLPWVARSTHEDALRMLREEHARVIARMIEENTRLFEKYHELRVHGANAPEPLRVIPPKPADPIRDAINRASAGMSGQVRAQMFRQVEIDRRGGLKDDEIVKRILAGHRPAEASFAALCDHLATTSTPSGGHSAP